jgi:hypothetical protein
LVELREYDCCGSRGRLVVAERALAGLGATGGGLGPAPRTIRYEYPAVSSTLAPGRLIRGSRTAPHSINTKLWGETTEWLVARL